MNVPDLIPTGRRPPQAAREETPALPESRDGTAREKSGATPADFGRLLEAGADTPAPPAGPSLQMPAAQPPAEAPEPALAGAPPPEIAPEIAAETASETPPETVATVPTADPESPDTAITPETPDPGFALAEPAKTPPPAAAAGPEIAARIATPVPATPGAPPAAPDAKIDRGGEEPAPAPRPHDAAVPVQRDAATPVAPAAKPVASNTEPGPAPRAGGPEPDRIEGDDGPSRYATAPTSPAGDARPATPAAAVSNATPATLDAPRALGEFQTGTGWRLAADAAPLHAARAEAVQQAAVSPQHVAGQITLAIAAASEGSVEIRLDPPELGRVQIRLDATDNGVRAVVMAERPETQDLLRRNSETLARDLTEAGYSSVSLDFSAGGQSAQQRDERLAQFAAAAPVPLAAREAIRIEPPRQNVAGRLDIRL